MFSNTTGFVRSCFLSLFRSLAIVAIASSLLISLHSVSAEEGGTPEKKKTPLPKSGILSSSVSSGSASTTAAGVWGTDPDGTGGSAPVGGSVSRLNPTTWQLKIMSQSPDTYSVNLSVRQLDARGTQVKVDSYSYTLKPGQSETRMISSASNAANAILELRSYTNVSEKKREREKKAKKDSGAASPTSDGSTPYINQ